MTEERMKGCIRHDMGNGRVALAYKGQFGGETRRHAVAGWPGLSAEMAAAMREWLKEQVSTSR